LAATVGLSVATEIQMDAVGEKTAYIVAGDGIAGLVSSSIDLKSLTAPFEHLRHERQAFEMSVLVKCRKNLVLASDLDPIARTELHDNFPCFSQLRNTKRRGLVSKLARLATRDLPLQRTGI
jgi:hypothetical protein